MTLTTSKSLTNVNMTQRPLSGRPQPERFKVSMKMLAEEVSILFDEKGESSVMSNINISSQLSMKPFKGSRDVRAPSLNLSVPKPDTRRHSREETFSDDIKEYRKQLYAYIQETRRAYVYRKQISAKPPLYDVNNRPSEANVVDLLHYACAVGNETLLRELLERERSQNRNLDINTKYLDKESNNCTLLHKATRYQQLAIMSTLIEYGASMEMRDNLEATPIFYSAAGNCTYFNRYYLLI